MPPEEDDPYMPSDSIELRIGDEIDWTSISAVYERDDSTKGNTNPKSQHSNNHHQQQQQQQPSSNSQRFSGNLKPKAPIIALPNKIRNSAYVGSSTRRLPNGRMFPDKKGIDGHDRRSGVPMPEPGSPKVSCFGKVRSDRERERRGGGGCLAWLRKVFRRSPPVKTPWMDSSEVAPAGLAAVKQFSSVRRPALWEGDVVMNVPSSEPLDWEGLRSRQSVG